jgi:hypothetical protein
MDTSDTIEFFRAVAKHVVTMKMTFVCFSGFKLLEEANVQFPQLRQLFVRDAHGVCPPEFLMFLEKHVSSLETLSVQHCPIGSLPPPSCSAAPRLQTLLWDNPCEDTPEQAVKSALAGYCTHLRRFFSPLFGVSDVVLRELGAHCPRLQQLHVRFKPKGDGAEAMAALVSVLQVCRALRILDLTIDARLTQEQAIALAEHCYCLTALKVSTIHEDTLALMLPSLGSLQHLMVGSIAVTSPAPLSLAVHCRQLRSLSFTFSRTGRIENALVTLFQNLSFLEDLRLCVSEAGCLTDSVLLTLAAHCRDLRSLHVRGMSDISDFTEESVTALRLGCPLLSELQIYHRNYLHDPSKVQVQLPRSRAGLRVCVCVRFCASPSPGPRPSG